MSEIHEECGVFGVYGCEDGETAYHIYRGLFAFSEDWDEELLDPVIAQTENLCRR